MSDATSPASYLEFDGERIAYRHLAGRAPTVVFFCGFRSDMTGTKACHLERLCAGRGQAFLRFDYTGHGASSGEFENGSIGRWSADALALIRAVVAGPALFVGSSMGAWIMLIVARGLTAPPSALVGIASAPDFTADLMPARMSATQREALARDGRVELPSAYSDEPTVLSAHLLDEAHSHLQLRAPIPLRCPVRLIHGERDPDVPWERSLALSRMLESEDVRLILVKGGDHRLSTPADLALLGRTLSDLLDGH